MKKLIISLNYKPLKDLIKKDERYYYFTITSDVEEFEKSLLKIGCKKIDIDKIKLKKCPDFEKNYIDFIGDLSKEFHSKYWWANSLSAKNTFLSNFHITFYYYFITITILKQNQYQNIILISDDDDLNSAIEIYSKNNNIDFKTCISKEKQKEGRGKYSFINYIRYLFNFITNGWKKKWILNKCLKEKVRRNIKQGQKYYLLRNWLDTRSLRSPTEYYDAYYGKLPDYLRKRNMNIIISGGVLKDFDEVANYSSKIQNVLIIPQEYFIGYLDFLKVAIFMFINELQIKTPIYFKDVDVTHIVNMELKKNHRREVATNLLYEYYLKNMTREIDIHTYTYTFENHAWEKITLLALSKYSPKTRTIGYQHTRVMKALLNYFPGLDEKDIIPLPEKIITTGKKPLEILKKFGHYRNGLLTEGCALRYEYLFDSKIISRNKSYNILATLTASIEESARIVRFLEKSLGDNKKYTIIYRCHPAVPFDIIKANLGFEPKGNYRVSKNARLLDDLAESDILLYTLSTVCIEALMVGIPIIHIDLGDPINVDPLFDCPHLKWSVKLENELLDILKEIYAISDKEFKVQQELGRKYMLDYFSPVEDKKMDEFII